MRYRTALFVLRFLTLPMAALGGPAAVQTAQPPKAVAAATAAAPSYDDYRIISDRNIFNPNRIGLSPGGGDVQPPQGDVIALVGTLQYEKGLFALFDGNDPAYRKALHVGDMIAQYTVVRISQAEVILTRDKNQVSLKMGAQLRRPPGGDWSLSSDQDRSDLASRPDQTVEKAPASTESSIPADASDTLRRLMEQRQKQLKQ